MALAASPKAFISYAWTDEEYSERVLALATRLREDGIDATIDKWDLQTGHDANAFMEKMVSDKDIAKVIIVSNKVYAEKADARSGGVGIEAQILTPELYKSVAQDKFGLVAFELKEDGKPYVPAFYGSRIYINLASDTGYEEEYERLVRWVYDKPLHKKPSIGVAPSFLEGTRESVGTSSSYNRALELLKSGKPGAQSALRDFQGRIQSEFRSRRIEIGPEVDFDEKIVTSIEGMRPLVSQYREIVTEIVRSGAESLFDNVLSILEISQTFTERGKDVHHWREVEFDAFRFISHEMLVNTAAVLLRERRFDLFRTITTHRFASVRESSSGYTHDFSAFYKYISSLDHRNARLKLNRVSVHADMFNTRYSGPEFDFEEIVQADFMLFLADAASALRQGDYRPSWWPVTLLYVGDRYRPLDIFARSESANFAAKVAGALGYENADGLRSLCSSIGAKDWAPRQGFFYPSLPVLMNVQRLGIFP